MNLQCNYPDCNLRAAATWALVPLCRDHQEAIRTEVIRYYLTRGTYRRQTYERIRHLTPWGGASQK